MVNSLENIDKSKVYVDRIEGLDEVVEDVIGDTLVGAVSTITTSDLTANKILVSDANGKVAASNKAITYIGGDGDNLSITKNASDKLETVGVINQNNTTSAIKTWTGTLAQYNAIAIKDSNTLYNITDDMQANTYQAYTKTETDTLISTALSNTLSALYPVGSIYIGIQNNGTCPIASLIPGSVWELVATNRTLWGGNGTNANAWIEAGLPNITGQFVFADNIVKNANSAIYMNNATGCFSPASVTANTCAVGGVTVTSVKSDNRQLIMNASSSSSIYGNSNTVQPPAYVVNVWCRTA